MNYSDYTTISAKRWSDFPIFYAFSNEQLHKGLQKFETSIDKICSIGAGGYIKKSDKLAFRNMMQQDHAEFEELMKDDAFLYDALETELLNHEYCYTHDKEPAFDALGLDYNDVRALEMLNKILAAGVIQDEIRY